MLAADKTSTLTETHTQTHTQMDTHREMHVHTHTHRKREREGEGEGERERETERQRDRETEKDRWPHFSLAFSPQNRKYSSPLSDIASLLKINDPSASNLQSYHPIVTQLTQTNPVTEFNALLLTFLTFLWAVACNNMPRVHYNNLQR